MTQEKPLFWALGFTRFPETTSSYFYKESSREARRLIDLLKELLMKPLKEPYKRGLNRVSKHDYMSGDMDFIY